MARSPFFFNHGVFLHSVLRFGFQANTRVYQLPLVAALVLGGIPLIRKGYLTSRMGAKMIASDRRPMELSQQKLSTLFSPRSVAVIGASRDPTSVGYAILKNIVVGGFQGEVYPVNPKTEEISGLRCYPSVAVVPGEVDLAMIVVKANLVPDVLERCGQKKVKAAIVISAGFKEIGADGAVLEEKVKEAAARHQIALVGPNCLGMLNTDPAVRLNATFAKEMPATGNIAFISQSGALCTAVLEYAKSEGIGFSKLISMGNKAGVTELDLLSALRDDPKTKVILLYIEDLTAGRRFIESARQISGEGPDRKPILAIKSGRTPEGAKAVSSHTGSLAGSDEVYDAIFAQAGVLRVDSVDELFDYARAFADQPLPKGRRMAIITNAGGPGIMATDACIRYGLELAQLAGETQALMRPALPPTASLHNPVDLIGDAREDRYEAALGAVAQDPNVDGIITLTTPQAMTNLETIARVVVKAAHNSDKPILACFMGVTDISAGVKVLEEGGVPHYRFPEAAVRAIAAMSRYQEWLHRPRTEVKVFQVNRKAAQDVIARARKESRRALNQSESLEVFRAYGLPVPPFGTARTVSEAEHLAEKIGFPLVMKILSPDILHKVDVGGVRLNLKDPDQVRWAFEEMIQTVSQRCPDAKIEGALLQQMVPQGTELILGMKRDKQFGPVLMFGLGGIYVEVFKDVTFRLAPVRELGAQRMIESPRANKILRGFRGQPPADIPALVESIERISQLSTELEEIEELDINPLMAHPEGQGCRVADARILVRMESSPSGGALPPTSSTDFRENGHL